MFYRKKKRHRIKKRKGIFRPLMIGLVFCMVLAAGPAMFAQGQAYPDPVRLSGRAMLMDLQKNAGFPVKFSAFWQEILKWFGAGSGGDWEATPAPLSDIPGYEGESCCIINGNDPGFTAEELSREPYEAYGKLDLLGRCTAAEAMISRELMPTAPREGIGMIQPTGWHTVKYDIIEDRYLYNRCHLIGYQLTGENANERNLITGTRYMNVSGMLPWENLVADYVRRSGDRVFYRVTPIFDGMNLLASGVHIQAQSVSSDNISFNIYVYNIQPGIWIDYRTGKSRPEE